MIIVRCIDCILNMRSVEEIEKFADEIWDNWLTNSGNCKNCALRRDPKEISYAPVGTLGNPSSYILIIGKNPGPTRRQKYPVKNRRDYNKRFWNDACKGKRGPRFFPKINMMLKYVGLNLEKIHFTNVCRCSSLGEKQTKEGIRNCISYLEQEISLSKPKMIITFGKDAYDYTRQILNVEGGNRLISKQTGKYIKENNLTILPFLHPSRRGRNFEKHLKEGIEKAKKNLLL